MFLLTRSQLDCYQIDCENLEMNASAHGFFCLKDYFKSVISPFELALEQKKILVNIVEPDSELNSKLCTDYRIFEGILYHLFANAIKYSSGGEHIDVILDFQESQ